VVRDLKQEQSKPNKNDFTPIDTAGVNRLHASLTSVGATDVHAPNIPESPPASPIHIGNRIGFDFSDTPQSPPASP